jgi:hypothetical protein
MWGSFLVRDVRHIAGAAMLRVILLPCLIFAMVVSSVAFASWYWDFQVWADKTTPLLLFSFWYGLGLVNNIGWLIYIRKRLPDRLRTYALQRYSSEEKRSWLAFLHRKKAADSSAPPILAPIPHKTRS